MTADQKALKRNHDVTAAILSHGTETANPIALI